MTILILTNNDVGLYRFRRELLERLCIDHKVFFALPYGKMIPELKKIGGTYIPFEFRRRGMNPFADLGQLLRYIFLIRKIKPDVVLTYTIKPNIYGGIACRFSKTPYIATVTGLGTAVENGGLLGRISTALYRMGLKRASCVFFQNEANKKFFIQRRVVTGKRRLVPGSGVNLNDYPLMEYPCDFGKIRFLYAGRIMKNKGIEELFSAVRMLYKTHQDISLEIIGDCDEDYSFALLQAEREGFARHLPYQTAVQACYQFAHCVVLPSYHEGMSNVLLEAAATGRPVITTNVPGCKEAFDEGVTGFGCNARDVDSLVTAIEKFLTLSQKEKAEMGRAGREKIEREFDRSIVIRAYEEEIHLAVRMDYFNKR